MSERTKTICMLPGTFSVTFHFQTQQQFKYFGTSCHLSISILLLLIMKQPVYILLLLIMKPPLYNLLLLIMKPPLYILLLLIMNPLYTFCSF